MMLKNLVNYIIEDTAERGENLSGIKPKSQTETAGAPAILGQTSQPVEIQSSGAHSSTLETPSKPIKILKPKGNFDKVDKIATTRKSLTFADQHGEALVENNFVRELHYSEYASQTQAVSNRGCCSIS